MKFDGLLYAVTDRRWTQRQNLFEQVEEALAAGVTAVQLREKNLEADAFLETAARMKSLTDRYGVPLIINDNLSVALAVDAAGLHLGQEDLEAGRARELLGPDKILGVTAKTVPQAMEAQEQGADYLGSGAVFGSFTKAEARPMSLKRLKEIAKAVSIPVVAIGGIDGTNILRLAGTGIAGAAVVSGIFAQPSIGVAVRDLRDKAEKITGRING